MQKQIVISKIYRIGEASNPGPFTHMFWAHSKGFDCLSIPRDGQCLYASIAYHTNTTPEVVRENLLGFSIAHATLFNNMGFPPTSRLKLRLSSEADRNGEELSKF